MAQTKFDWRRILLAERAAISEANRRAASETIAMRVRGFPSFVGARTLLGYVALGAEVDPASLLAAAGIQETRVLVPSPGSRPEDPRWVTYGWRGDLGDREISAEALAGPILAVVPGVGFDVFGTRLGRGGGFYDRALASIRRTDDLQVVGLAFECQVVPVLPYDPWDQRVDLIVSEQRVVITTEAQTR